MMLLGRGYEFFGHCFSPEYGLGRGMNRFWPMHGFGGFGGFFTIALLAIVGIVVYVIISRRRKTSSLEKAIDSLNYKYVNGDINEEEYLRKKELIQKK